MMTLAYYGFLRPGEITDSTNNIYLHQVQLQPASIMITFQRFKHHTGPPVSINIASHPGITCPVTALHNYLSQRGMSPGPLFCTHTGHPITYHTLSMWFKSLLIRCNMPQHINLHSFRIGAATDAYIRGVSSSDIKIMGRWNSSAYQRYIRVPRINL